MVTHISRVKTVSYSINIWGDGGYPGNWCPVVLFFAFPTVYIGHLSRAYEKGRLGHVPSFRLSKSVFSWRDRKSVV